MEVPVVMIERQRCTVITVKALQEGGRGGIGGGRGREERESATRNGR